MKKREILFAILRNRLYNSIMPIEFNDTKIFTMDDIAAELGISKSTVSRALSGSNRISEETRQKVKECARKHNFRPNSAAKALAINRTLNIACVMPLEATALQMMFFHECLSGMVSRSAQAGYSILVCMVGNRDSSQLENLLENRKVDAVILTQLKKNDRNVQILKKSGIPFDVIGSGAGDDIVQIDSKMSESCSEFTRLCVSRLNDSLGRSVAERKVLFVCGSLDVEANNNRLSGFLDGIESIADAKVKYSVCTQLEDLDDEINLSDWDLILCSDDIVCAKVLDMLTARGLVPGKDVRAASFHDSILLEGRSPSVSALRVDAFSLGAEAVTVAVRMVDGGEYKMMNYVDCSYQMRETA